MELKFVAAKELVKENKFNILIGRTAKESNGQQHKPIQ